jgi:hypothetical protein
VQGRNSNFFLSGWWWIADGTMTITTQNGVIKLPFTINAINTAQMIMNIRSYALSTSGGFGGGAQF